MDFAFKDLLNYLEVTVRIIPTRYYKAENGFPFIWVPLFAFW
jgi:hypothetical protein